MATVAWATVARVPGGTLLLLEDFEGGLTEATGRESNSDWRRTAKSKSDSSGEDMMGSEGNGSESQNRGTWKSFRKGYFVQPTLVGTLKYGALPSIPLMILSLYFLLLLSMSSTCS